MPIGMLGKKIGMTQVWDKDGRRVAVTVLEVGPCPVIQVKTAEKDGYQAAQLGFGSQKPQRLTKSAVARYAKAGVPPCRVLHEFRLDAGDTVETGFRTYLRGDTVTWIGHGLAGFGGFGCRGLGGVRAGCQSQGNHPGDEQRRKGSFSHGFIVSQAHRLCLRYQFDAVDPPDRSSRHRCRISPGQPDFGPAKS